MRDETNVMLIRMLFGDLERDSKLLLRVRPVSLDYQAKPACICTFKKSLRILRDQLFGFFQQLESFRVPAFPACETCQRVQRFGLARCVHPFVQQIDGPLQKPRRLVNFGLKSGNVGVMKERTGEPDYA